ncbi:LOW QUALITY PROTEIN: hypothetical protein U9M48_004207 [Paspalum notatum var. saurae]|uniref:Retroviral polymerase SH3-like domain-containing protein n=1 Tax=Paspalum notatum var. saurae TaxID=547442 RepID=A0AAQ3SKL9_PASNO
MARTMLDEHRTPSCFWLEAVNTACYIANRIFLRAFLGKTSYELWFCSVKHLRPFGCRCFVLKKVGHMDKFESRCLDGIFLGYSLSSRAFRVWILETRYRRLVRFLSMRLCLAQPLLLSFRMMMKKAPPSLKMRKVQLMLVMQAPLHRLQLLAPLLQALKMKEDLCLRLPPHFPDYKLKHRLAPLRMQGR